MVGRLALSAVLGAIIGYEREYRGYPAGVRTMALVCVGSALFSEMSRTYAGNDRIAAQVASGVGFLGAGLILREGMSIKGITTAATIWAVAAIGMTVAIEAYIVAVFAAALTVVVLEMRLITQHLPHGSGWKDDEGAHDDENGR